MSFLPTRRPRGGSGRRVVAGGTSQIRAHKTGITDIKFAEILPEEA